MLPVTRLVRFAPSGQERPHFCDFCHNRLAGDADAPHIFLACPAWATWAKLWLDEVDLAFARTPAARGALAWWQGLRGGPPTHAGLAAALTAAGCPLMPSGKLSSLRKDLAQAFVRTAGTWVAGRVEWIDSLPPARRDAAAGSSARLSRATSTQPRRSGAAAAAGGAALRRAASAPPPGGGHRGSQPAQA
jgi:hypothetical protein